ncbi:MAG: branched-chain amino acid ABC transporter permease [Spirochaetales bacterium]|nr:MAG: branched-chain amino acid ABC transporter permease [Spirochaetales bacterium]
MREHRRIIFIAAFRAGFPVLLGYVTIGLAYGLVLVGAGLPWWLSPISALFVYAGAAQFMGVGLIVSGTGLIEIAVLTLLMNARHMVYGLSMLKRFSGAGLVKGYLVFGLTDETYGLLTTVNPPDGIPPVSFYAAVTVLNQSYWVFGCTLGALLGAALPFDTAGLDFALTSLFVVLLVEQMKSVKRIEPYLAAVAGASAAYFLAAPRDFLLVALLVAVSILALTRRRLESSGDTAGKDTR